MHFRLSCFIAPASTRERRGKRNRNGDTTAAPSSVPVPGPNGSTGGSRTSKRSRGGDSAHGGRLSYVGQRQMTLRTVFTPEAILSHVNALSRDGLHQQAYTYLVEHMEVFHDLRQLEAALNPLLQNVRAHLASLAPRISAQAGITTPAQVFLAGQRTPTLIQLHDTSNSQSIGRKSPGPEAYSDTSMDDAMLTARSNSSASGYHSPLARSPSRENTESMSGVQVTLPAFGAHPVHAPLSSNSFVPGTIPTTARSFTPILNTPTSSSPSLVPSSLRGFPVFANGTASTHVQSPMASPHLASSPVRSTPALDSSGHLTALALPSISVSGHIPASMPNQTPYETSMPIPAVPHAWVEAKSPRLAAIQESNPYSPEFEEHHEMDETNGGLLGSGEGIVIPSSPSLSSSSYALEAATASSSVSSFSTSTQYSSSTAYSTYSSAAYCTPSKNTPASKTVRHGYSAPSLTSAFSLALQTSHSPPPVLQSSHSPPPGDSHFYRSIHSPIPSDEVTSDHNQGFFSDLDVGTMEDTGAAIGDDYFWSQPFDS